MSQLYSNVTEAGDNAVNCRIVQHFTGGQKCKLLSRSSLFIKPNGDQIGALLSAYGDEATQSVRLECSVFSQCMHVHVCSLCYEIKGCCRKGVFCFEMALANRYISLIGFMGDWVIIFGISLCANKLGKPACLLATYTTGWSRICI